MRLRKDVHTVIQAGVSRVGDTPDIWGDKLGTCQAILCPFPLMTQIL